MVTNRDIRWILAGAASAGVVLTGVEASLATYDICTKKPDKWWKKAAHYIPSAVIGGLTIGSIIGGNIIADETERKLVMAVAAAYGIYAQNKKRTEEEVVVVQRKVITGEEELYFDMTLGVDEGYFPATELELANARLRLNKELQQEHTVAYERFYQYLNLPVPKGCMNKGWSIGAGVVYGYEWIEIEIEEERLDDGLVVHRLRFIHPPREDYLDYADDWIDE